MKRLPFLIATILVSNLILAQSARSVPKYPDGELFTVNDGLSQGLVNGITQDHFGFMWFATLDGLNRYDGYTTTVYRHDPDDSNSVSDNFITSVFVDSKQRLWIGTSVGGLNLFNYEKEQFIHFHHLSNNKNSLSDDHVVCVSEDNNGALWVGTKNGLNKIIISEKNIADSKSDNSIGLTIKHIQLEPSGKDLYLFHEATSTRESFLPSCFIDLNGFVFIRTEFNYFCILPSSTKTDTIIKIPQLRINVEDEQKVSAIKSITQSNYDEQLFLFFMAEKYIAKIDAYSGVVTLNKQFKRAVMQLNPGHPFINESLWFVQGFHSYQYSAENQQVAEIKSNEANEQLGLEHATGVYKDRNDKIWLGTGGYGLLKINTASEKFHRTKGSSTHWFYAISDNQVITREGETTYLLQKKRLNQELPAWQKDSNFFKPVYKQLAGRYLRLAAKGTEEMLWLQADGIRRYNLQSNKLDVCLGKPIAWSALYVDDENALWFADGDTLCKIQSKASGANRYAFPQQNKGGEFYVETIFRDSQHTVWIGTTAGLFRFDEKHNAWNQYSFHSNNIASLSSNLVLSICADADNKYLWIGTNGGGFNRFSKETGICKRYTTKDGLSNNVVYGILTDDAGGLWMSTNRGISNYDPGTNKFENYTAEDGLQDNEFNGHAYCKAKDGTLFFGGVKGYNYFNPKDIHDGQAMQPIVITDVKSNGKSIDFLEKNSPLLLPAYLTKKIVLNYSRNTVSFTFSAMYFKTATHDKYQYKLEGVDKDWVYSSTNNSAVYSNLQPGGYVFKVKAGGLNDDYTSIDIKILPPWYLTWWFMTLLALFITALMYFFYRYNLNYEINRFKDHQRIASDLHDEIGSTLSSIHIYSEVALNKILSKPAETETYLKQISNSVENTIGSLDDIVWALKAKDDRFEDIVNRMRAAAVSLCEASGYALTLDFDEGMNEMKVEKDMRKNLFLIYKEAINNVMKYADGKSLYVSLSSSRNEIILSIKDDGKGFDLKDSNNGNGLSNMRKRAKELKGKLDITSAPGNGTHIVLRFSRSGGL